MISHVLTEVESNLDYAESLLDNLSKDSDLEGQWKDSVSLALKQVKEALKNLGDIDLQ